MSCDTELLAGATGTWRLEFRGPALTVGEPGPLTDPDEILVVHRSPDGNEQSYTEASAEVFQNSPASTGIWFFQAADLTVGEHLIYYRGDGATERIVFTVGPDGTTTV